MIDKVAQANMTQGSCDKGGNIAPALPQTPSAPPTPYPAIQPDNPDSASTTWANAGAAAYVAPTDRQPSGEWNGALPRGLERE